MATRPAATQKAPRKAAAKSPALSMGIAPTPAQYRDYATIMETTEDGQQAAMSWRLAIAAAAEEEPTPLRDADIIEMTARAVAAEKHEVGSLKAAMTAAGKIQTPSSCRRQRSGRT